MKPLHFKTTLLSLALCVCFSAAAQDDGRAAREREALRRSQAALKQAQEQQAVLAREKTELTAQQQKLSDEAKQAQSQLGGARSEAGRLRAEVNRLSAELTALKTQMEADKKLMLSNNEAAQNAAQQAAQKSAQQLSEAERLNVQQTRTVASMTALLERSTTALAAAEKANREMHALGLQLIDQVRGKSASGLSGLSNPVLGLGQVKLENTAEQLRDQLDALKVVKSPGS
jgi:predicted nuclease with TOPRIM domain